MAFPTYRVTLNGETPLLMHRDNISYCEKVRAWSKHPSNKGQSVAGDDRSPAWTWIGYCYHNGETLVLDADNLMTMLRDGGARCPAPVGKGTLKAITQSGLMVNEIGWELMVHGKTIPWSPIVALENELDFAAHEQVAESLGFSLFAKRAKVGMAKHIRVRPRFEDWTASGTISILDPKINEESFREILTHAGAYAGIGDWRPGAKQSPGQFGRFTVEIERTR